MSDHVGSLVHNFRGPNTGNEALVGFDGASWVCIQVVSHFVPNYPLRFLCLCLQLDYTHDPIADFINAVQSDVIAFGSQRR